tara:strand:- start:303 stop:743 length:441 start_codon:yes stop_codon:yes gene_type:complete
MYDQTFWETDKHTRMLLWRDWRNSLKEYPTEDLYNTIAQWWKMVPMSNRTIDVWKEESWPTPWELIVFSSFCNPSKGLGIYYTLALIDIESNLVLAQKDRETTLLVTLDDGKLLNYYEGEVLDTSHQPYEELKIFTPAEMHKLVKV